MNHVEMASTNSEDERPFPLKVAPICRLGVYTCLIGREMPRCRMSLDFKQKKTRESRFRIEKSNHFLSGYQAMPYAFLPMRFETLCGIFCCWLSG
ncbi:hypothetical protein [Novosphingobium naphthalenivorans]|uniref:hypothetical protein n=1 Tax=Novosphingobium naphthalenivorans TaxID=273168 RepID=UPI0012ED21D1|nr:hypothetical protein [Novosphingobium naphthalenivorans]